MGRFAGVRVTTIQTANSGTYKRVVVGIGYQKFHVASIVWCMFNDEWPRFELDHINGDSLDNRIENLRDVPHSVNGKNLPRMSHNTSGVAGISWNKRRETWMPYITANGRRMYLGATADFDLAVLRRKHAEREHMFHENHGRG